MDGATLAGDLVTLQVITGDFEIAGMADFNGDGKTDFVWRNRAGTFGLWLMNGPGQPGSFSTLGTLATLTTATAGWEVVGIGDFNADAKLDIVLQSRVGDHLVLFLNGTTFGGSFKSLPNVGEEWVISLVADFNGDGKPDLLWSNMQTGLRGFWFMDGLNPMGGLVVLATVPTEWVLTQAGDFNADGKPDIVWTNTITGERGIWLLNGTTQLGDFVRLPTISTDWRLGSIAHPGLAAPVIGTKPVGGNVVAGSNTSLTFSATSASNGTLTYRWYKNNVAITGATNTTLNFPTITTADSGTYYATATLNGLVSTSTTPVVLNVIAVPYTGDPKYNFDFNENGKSDVLWQNLTTGQRGYWPMNDTVQVGSSFVSFDDVAGDWVITGVADFDGDGMMDFLWRNRANGTMGLWLMNGTVMRGSFILLGNMPPVWNVAGVGDFNSDGKPDIVWQNTSDGRRGVWFLAGTTYDGNYLTFAVVPTRWVISLVADFNNDQKPDLVWTDTLTGLRGFWLMNGLVQQGGFYSLAVVPTPWVLAQAGDFNADGQTDLVWSNVSTGQRGIWLMNGITLASDFIPIGTIPTDWQIGPIH